MLTMDMLTTNQVIAQNLLNARRLRSWTQDEAAERMEPFLGVRWSRATFSLAERSIDGRRVRQFTADEIMAFALAFDLPILWFFLPPTETLQLKSGSAAIEMTGLLRLLFPSDTQSIWDRLSTLKKWQPDDARWREVQLLVRDHLIALLARLGYEASLVPDLDVMVARLQEQLKAQRAINAMMGEPSADNMDSKSQETAG